MKPSNLLRAAALAVASIILIALLTVFICRSQCSAHPARPASASAPAGQSTAAVDAIDANHAARTTIGSAPTKAMSAHDAKMAAARKEPVDAEKALLARAETLTTRDAEPDERGVFTRTRLVRVPGFKYPLLRVEEVVHRDAVTGEEKVVRRTEAVADHVMVRIQPGVSEESFTEAYRKHGGEPLRKMHTPGLFLVSFANPDLDTLPRAVAALSGETAVVKRAEPDYVVFALDRVPNDPSFNLLWGMHNTGQTIGGQPGIADADIDAPAAWEVGTGSRSVVVGVIDTGIDYTHPDLAANMWKNPDEIAGNGVDDDGNGFIDDVYGWDFYDDDSDPMDEHYHGTHCAGTIGGVGNNSVGVAGVCWSVKLMALRFLGPFGGYTSDGIDAINYATMMRVRLTSNSWGGGGFEQELEDAIAEAGRSNILFVAAAGNSGTDNDEDPHYPSTYTNDNIIAVAATDNRDDLANFSCYGLASVDLGAPGVDVYSCEPGNQYQYLSGTSMATPHVAGACALAYSLAPSLSAMAIKGAILTGVDEVSALNGQCVTGGRLNIAKTLETLGYGVDIEGVWSAFYRDVGAGPMGGKLIVGNIGSRGGGAATHEVYYYGSDGSVVLLRDVRFSSHRKGAWQSITFKANLGVDPSGGLIVAFLDVGEELKEIDKSNNIAIYVIPDGRYGSGFTNRTPGTGDGSGRTPGTGGGSGRSP